MKEKEKKNYINFKLAKQATNCRRCLTAKHFWELKLRLIEKEEKVVEKIAKNFNEKRRIKLLEET